ncbi:lysozyme inhibitor LprI family protein [Clostridium sp.]|uniref:lysozyme inhibitor LprI family protein n=1 Tax=Clostridium sp. TaxID=1506 RepID=UPI003F67478B
MSSQKNKNFNNNFNGKKKSSSTIKILIGIIIAILIIVAAIITFCFYKNSTEVDAFKTALTKFNSVNAELNKTDSNDITENKLTSFATSLNDLSGEFDVFSKEVLLGKDNRIKAKDYSALAKYLSYKESFLVSVLKIQNECQSIVGTPGPDQVQNIIDDFQNLLSNNNFIQMINIYNGNSFVQSKLPNNLTPPAMKNHINSMVNKLSALKNGENFVNGIDNAFGQDATFTDSSVANANTDTDTSVPTAYASTPSEKARVSSSNSSSEPAYVQNLHALSGKYQTLISNALNQFGNEDGGNLVLPNDPSSAASVTKQYYNTWNTILNDVWQDLEANLPSDQMSILRSQETDWINSKDGKTPAEVAQMTKDRTMYLINTYITPNN